MGRTMVEGSATSNADGTVTTGYSFNPWWGCVKVSPGCAHCYAETLSKRYGHQFWGPASTTGRRTFGDAHWREPLRWNATAAKTGQRTRVFCAPMADVFEVHPTAAAERPRVWDLIEQTPMLDWLLLTKRPQNIAEMFPAAWREEPRPHVWLGTSCEDQKRADERIPPLLRVPAAVHWLSCEPLLGPITFNLMEEAGNAHGDGAVYHDLLTGRRWMRDGVEKALPGTAGIDWVSTGGESGAGARPMHPDWARQIRDACQAAGVAFFHKQNGAYRPVTDTDDDDSALHVGQFTDTRDYYPNERSVRLVRVGNKAAGRELDGRTWDESPR